MPKKAESTFDKDDFVVYPTHGVGRILGTESRDVGGSTLEMLVVRFEHDRMTLRVPLEKACAGKRHDLEATSRWLPEVRSRGTSSADLKVAYPKRGWLPTPSRGRAMRSPQCSTFEPGRESACSTSRWISSGFLLDGSTGRPRGESPRSTFPAVVALYC